MTICPIRDERLSRVLRSKVMSYDNEVSSESTKDEGGASGVDPKEEKEGGDGASSKRWTRATIL